ncbi:Arc family DNA-binding protein [Paracoccus sp. MC1862]|uniref:Arc family DNA-binding protein n=1 Tax=Paracoccus sp. MC1862 TaxID=2760307 RepID=UPI0016042E42|nr:Arc family DNA-binding protein [Paracoccus sp. MC1862]MBB1498788.1 Arc family DNA-binding protein [Paracoccus sp. MC1862]QQO43806.1 Arc family DNA-binding protein [Paracoccus sp. MC1862]
MSGKAGRGADQFMVRLPEGMRDRIKAAAEANNRSMNAEIVATLEEKYPRPVLIEEEIAKADALLAKILADPNTSDENKRLLALLAEETKRLIRRRRT